MENRRKPAPPATTLDINCDCKEYVLDYLLHSFPTQLHESFTDGDGNLASRPAYDEHGNVVQCREAIERRDRLIEGLTAMEPVQGALDQIVQRFGTDIVAEVTGRSRRIVRKIDANGDRLAVENRPAHANLAEAQAFMEDRKQILVFSDAGGTGRSYHADLGARNQRLRHHYLLEAGWKADTAIQGLGRTNRTNQAQPPLFRPVATNVQAEKRFLSTIARRLDTLGAITRGQRQTGGQGLFRPEDNLESPYARDALRQLYVLTRVYRLQTDDGTRIVGRRVSPAWAASATARPDAPVLSPPQALAMLREGHTVLDLADGLQLRRSRLMQVNRIELTGFGQAAVDRLKAMGLFSEIISWKLRLFVPDDGQAGSAVIERLFERHPLARIADRKAA